MATLTTNISNVSLTVSGTTTQTATISWTLPTVPSGGTITACTLTGTAIASMSKGSPTIKVNGTTVSSGSNFTINLGTNNTTSSVTATAVGNNKNAVGTVTLSNLVYTVDYTEPAVIYTVTFKDWDGTVLKTEEVGSGGSATAPEVSRYGYILTGWSVDFSEVRSDITTVAQYEIANVLAIKENGSWSNIGRVYKKTSGVWVEQVNSSWNDLFNTNIKYQQQETEAFSVAILYSDGTLIFSNSNNIDNLHGKIIKSYADWNITEIDGSAEYAWYGRNDIISISCSTKTSGIRSTIGSAANIFSNLPNLISVNLKNFSLSGGYIFTRMFSNNTNLTSVTFDDDIISSDNNMSFNRMFGDCSNLVSIDLSMFNGMVDGAQSMFDGCTNLSLVNISNLDFSEISHANSLIYMFRNCTKPDLTIYVKDETAKTAIESSLSFPSTATVIIGKPN